jgi:choline dehydrogenase-like flavoprotein
MAQILPPVDVVTIGVGLTGSLAALELAEAGLKVVGLERGIARDTVPDFQSPAIHDELRFSIRKAMMQDNVKVAVTFRNTSDQTALPIRRWESFLPGTGPGRLVRTLERSELPLSDRRLHLSHPHPQTLRPEISRRLRSGADDPGLGRHL